MTCYNLGQYLNEALDSVFAQTFQDFEIVIVDDGSTDLATVGLLDSFQRPRAHVVRIENRGLPGARNEGIRHSSGRFLCALDADDRLEPTWLEKAVAFLEANPHIAFVSHWLRTFGEESADWMPDRCDLETLLMVNTINGAALVRREAMIEVGCYDETMVHGCEDWDLWLTMAERGFAGAIIPEVLFFYRRRPDSMSREMSKGDRFQSLLETVVRKHDTSYRQHISTLIAARERELAGARRELNTRRLEQITTLLPQVTRSRQRLQAVRAKAERARRQIDEANDVARLRQSVERTRLATAEAEAERGRFQGEIAGLRGEIASLHKEVTDLRGSLTWRLSRPVRAVVGWLRRPRRT